MDSTTRSRNATRDSATDASHSRGSSRARAAVPEPVTSEPRSSEELPLCSVPRYMEADLVAATAAPTSDPGTSEFLSHSATSEAQSRLPGAEPLPTPPESALAETPAESPQTVAAEAAETEAGAGAGNAATTEAGPDEAAAETEMATATGTGESATAAGESQQQTGTGAPGTAAPGASASVEQVQRKADLPPRVIARSGNLRSPRVPSPPREAIKRTDEIRRRTGSPPEMHHAKIQQAVLRVVDVARAGQRQIVWRAGILAQDTRLSMEQLGQEILGFVGHCVRRVRDAISQAKTDIEGIVDTQLDHIFTQGELTGEALTQSQRDSQADVHDTLLAESEELTRLHTDIQAEFEPYLMQAQYNTRMIPNAGVVLHVDPPAGSESAPAAPASTSTSGEGATCSVPEGPRQSLSDVNTELQGQLSAMAGQGALGTFHSVRIAPVFELQSKRSQTQLEAAANRQADALESFRGQFTNYALRLVTPVARTEEQDQRGDADRVCSELMDERHNLAAAIGENGDVLIRKFDGVVAQLDNELGPRLINGLNEAGAKAASSFREQGETTERMLENTSAALADAYPQLVERVAELLPEQKFLDERELGPRLRTALESARRLPDQQYAALAEQAALAVAQAREGQKKQIQSIGESADKSLQAVQDVVTATGFDMVNFSYQVTGVMSEGGWSAITGAADYALRMARDLIKTRGETGGALNNLIGNFVESMNGAIDNAGNSYFDAVTDFRTSQIEPKTGVFDRIREDINGDLSQRSQKLNAQLTKPDPGVTTGLVVLNVLTLGATTAVTAGYLIYMDADDDEIFATIGNLQWPGPPALDEYFTREAGCGDLQQRLIDCLSPEPARRALALFSPNADVRAEGRLSAVQDSFNLFGLDADARRSLLQGFGAEERAAADPGQVRSVSESLRDLWFTRETEIRLNEAYLRGDYAAALSARMEDSLRQARTQSSDAIFQSVQNIETLARNELALTGSTLYLEPEQIQGLTDRAMQDFAAHRPGEHRAAKDISLTEARQTFIRTATADIYHPRRGGDGPPPLVPVDQMVKNYVQEVITGGWQSEQALAARQAYEFQHAGRGFSLSETDQNRVTRAFEDPRLARLERELREHPERREQIMPQLQRARREHEERMRRVAHRLNPDLTDEQIDAAGGGTAYMAQRTARLFSGGEEYTTGRPATERRSAAQEDAQYGYELITGGRASLTAGIRLATRGTGTNEDLLRMSYAGRSKAEIAEARTVWNARYDENLDQMLGIEPRPWTADRMAVTALSPALGMYLYGGETSGDLAMELQRLSRGEPETDQDYIELAALTYAQQRERGTGFLARLTMSGSAEAASLDSQQRQMGEMLLAEAYRRRAMHAGTPGASSLADSELPDSPRGVFLPDGRINPAVAALVFAPGPGSGGRPGAAQFLGDRSRLLNLSNEVELAGNRYKAEVDRQESLMLSAIAILAVVATVVLCAFGVGFVLASVIVALGSGLLTMAVKSGMRGERYGWEEAMTDAASTAIEVAAAGVGGALAGGLGKAGTLARAGQALVSRFGPIGGAVAREAIVGAVSSAAQVAIQDDTYKDGPGSAIGRIIGGGLKGAAISAVSAGVSESLGGGMNRRLNASLQQTDPAMLARLGQGLGPAGRNMLKEGVSEAIGSVAGEATGILIEISSNQYHGSLKDALKRLGQAGLRDLVQSGGRAGATAHHRARYNRLMADARNATHLSDSDLHALHAAARAAGEFPDSLNSIHRQVQADRSVLAQLPPELRRHAAGLDSQSLHQLADMLQRGDLGGASEARADLFMNLSERNPDLNAAALVRELEGASARLAPETVEPEQARARAEHQQQVRSQLTAHLPEPVRNALAAIPVHGLDQIPPHLLPDAARLIARGTFDPHGVDALLLKARQHNPDLDAVSFLRNLHSAVQSARLAGDAHTRILARQRIRVLRDIPPEAHGLFARLPDDAMGQLRTLLDQGHAGSPEQQAALLRQARALDPTLDSHHFRQLLEQAAGNAASRRSAEQSAARTQRQQQMSHVPEHLRGTLSVLPDSAQVELRLRQLEGSMSPAERLKLQEAAQREQPDLDLPAFHRALDEAVSRGTPIRPDAGTEQRMRQELVAGVPAAQRHLVQGAPILILKDSEFAAYTRSAKGDAVTLMLNGRAVVVVRQGTDPSALREEGIHVLQSRDPQWAARMGSLDEQHLRHWDELPLDQQMALYRNKLELELDAHDRLIEGLADDLRRATDPAEIAALRSRLQLAQQAQSNLENRLREVDAINPLQRQLISAGMAPRPQWLDQPARLFAKQPQAPPKTRQQILDDLTADLAPGSSHIGTIRKRIGQLADTDLHVLTGLGLTASEMRQVVLTHKAAADTRRLIGDLRAIADALPAGSERATLTDIVSRKNRADLVPLLRATSGRATDADSARILLNSVLRQPKHHVELARNLDGFLRQATPEQQADLVRLLDDIGMEGQSTLLKLLGEINARFASLQPDNHDPHGFAATLINLAASGSIKQKIDLLNRTHALLEALAQLPASAARDKVTNHIVDGLLGGGSALTHAFDIRAAAHSLQDGKLPPATLQRFADNIDLKQPMSGGNAFRLHVEESLREWSDFAKQRPEFADLLQRVKTVPPLTDEQRALLADMEPWFSHIVASEWFAQRMRDDGHNRDQAMLELLGHILKTGLRGQNGITSFDTLRHIMQELRLTVVDTLAEPDLIARVKEQMHKAGYSTEEIARREQEFDAVMRRDVTAGIITPEVHLENLIRQHAEYQGMLDMAATIARQRHPGDAKAERALYNQLTAGLQQKVTETAGEIAATRAMRTDPRFGVDPNNPDSRPMEIFRGFEAGTGFDQVWVRRDASGRITEILVVEAKGPGATTAQTKRKGAQMSAEWVARTAAEMVMHGDDGTGTLILDALRSGRPPIGGIVVQAADRTGTPGSITGAPGTHGPHHHFALAELRQHNPIKNAPPAELASEVRNRIASLHNGEFNFRYSDTEVRSIVEHGRSLGLREYEIVDLMFTGSRVKQAIPAAELMQQMTQYVNIVRDRGFPYGFDTIAAFTEFGSGLTRLLEDHGLPADNVRVLGSSVRDPAAKDVDIAVFVPRELFDKLATQLRRSRATGADDVQAQRAAGRINLADLDSRVVGSLPQELRNLIRQLSGPDNINISLMLRGSEFDIGPRLDI